MPHDKTNKVAKHDIDVIVEVNKFNPYHDAKGRFASADGATSFTYSPGKSKAHDLAIQREKDRQASMAGTKTGTGKYESEINRANSLDELDAIIERLANDDSLSNKEYEALYSKALRRAQSWDPQNRK